MLQTLPRERLLLETDCPYLGEEPGGRNEPAAVARTAGYAAEVWGLPVEEAAAQLSASFSTLFGAAP
jgi:TatD DNase family protein